MRSSERGKPPLPSQVGRVMGIFPFALGLFLGRISLITVQTAFFFFLRERRHLREAAGLCATHAISTALHTLEPASNLAQCQPVLAVWCGDQEWVPLPVGSGLCCLCPVPIKSRAPPGAL